MDEFDSSGAGQVVDREAMSVLLAEVSHDLRAAQHNIGVPAFTKVSSERMLPIICLALRCFILCQCLHQC